MVSIVITAFFRQFLVNETRYYPDRPFEADLNMTKIVQTANVRSARPEASQIGQAADPLRFWLEGRAGRLPKSNVEQRTISRSTDRFDRISGNYSLAWTGNRCVGLSPTVPSRPDDVRVDYEFRYRKIAAGLTRPINVARSLPLEEVS